MLIFILILAVTACIGLHFAPKGEFMTDYISPKTSCAVNGIFTVMVFFSHAVQYINTDGVADIPYIALKNHLGQMIVVTFLFYSGYGIMESIKKKGTPYVKDIPFKRFFKVFYHMAVAVVLYIILNLILGRKYSLTTTLLAFTGWKSIGNSNWYIFAVLVLYAITFVSFMIFRKNHYLAVSLVTVFTLVYVVVLMVTDTPSWYYNTAILFAAGMWYSLLRKYIEKAVMKNDLIYFTALCGAVILYILFYLNKGRGIEWYTVWAALFMALILLITMKVKIGNSVLMWFGSHVFSVYILQRIPMITLKHFGLNESHKYAFVIISFCVTIMLAVIFDGGIKKLDALIYERKKIKE